MDAGRVAALICWSFEVAGTQLKRNIYISAARRSPERVEGTRPSTKYREKSVPDRFTRLSPFLRILFRLFGKVEHRGIKGTNEALTIPTNTQDLPGATGCPGVKWSRHVAMKLKLQSAHTCK